MNRPTRIVLTSLICAGFAAGTGSGVAVGASSADATTPGSATHSATKPHRPAKRPHRPAKKPRIAAGKVRLSGVVISHSVRKLTIFASSLKVGRRRAVNKRVTVRLDTRHRSAVARSGHAGSFDTELVDGYRINLAGEGRMRDDLITLRKLRHEDHQVAAATAWAGTITTVDTTAVTATVRLGEDSCGEDGQEHGHRDNTVTVDYSTADVTIDGNPGNLAVGQLAVILGEASNLTVVAKTVHAFTSHAASVRGEIRAVSGTSVAVGEDDHAVTINLGSGSTAVPLILNGNPGATVGQLSRGDKILIVGTRPDGTTFVPALAIAFNSHDVGPVGENED